VPRPVSSPHRARRHPTGFVVLSVTVVGGLVLGLVGLNAILAQNAFVIEDLSGRVKELERRHERDQLEVARLTSPARIAEEASHLGLVIPPPRAVQVVHLGAPDPVPWARPEDGDGERRPGRPGGGRDPSRAKPGDTGGGATEDGG
jgi:hypothetical protein